MQFGKFESKVRDRLTLSSQLLAVNVDGQKEARYRETGTHLIEIPKCIVKKKSQEKVRCCGMPLPWIPVNSPFPLPHMRAGSEQSMRAPQQNPASKGSDYWIHRKF